MLGFSGPIAVLFSSITLSNVLLHPGELRRYLPSHHVELTALENDFFLEIVFLLRTFFFI